MITPRPRLPGPVTAALLTCALLVPGARAGYLYTFNEEFQKSQLAIGPDRVEARDLLTDRKIGDYSLSSLWFAEFRRGDTPFDKGFHKPLQPFPDEQFHGSGVLLTNGTFVGGKVTAFNQREAVVENTRGDAFNLRRELIARVNFNPTVLGDTPVVPPGATGALLKNGNFVEGEVLGMREQRARIRSVIFGPQSYSMNILQGLVLRDFATVSCKWIVSAKDGSRFLTNRLELRAGGVQLDDLAVGEVSLPAEHLATIHSGRARAEPLTALEYLRRPPTSQPGEDLQVRSGPSTTAPLVVDPETNAITMPAGTAMAVRIEDDAYGFAARIGLPEGTSEREAVIFRVIGDRELLYRSDPKTVSSGEEIVVVRTPLRSAIVLEVVPGNEVTNETPALWVEPVLLRN